MFLPPELLTILFLACGCSAELRECVDIDSLSIFLTSDIAAGLEAATNGTVLNASPAQSPEPTLPPEPTQAPDPTFAPEDEFAPPWEDPCSTESCWPINFIPDLPTATGWEEDDNNFIAAPTGAVIPEEPPTVVTIRTPTVIGLQTGTVPAVTNVPAQTKTPDNAAQPGQKPDDGTNNPSMNSPGVNNPGADNPTEQVSSPGSKPGPAQAPAQPSGVKADNALQNTLPAAAQPPTNNDLLFSIISRMGSSLPSVQPAATASGNNDQRIPAQAQITPASNNHNAITTQPSLALGATLTIGSATVTLTPGLSTTVGQGTSIGITTDTQGQTLITVASSGTAVTATVTDAPATMTVPKNEFAASITAAARPGSAMGSGANRAVASSSSTAGGGSVTVTVGEVGWWMRGVLGVLGVVGLVM